MNCSSFSNSAGVPRCVLYPAPFSRLSETKIRADGHCDERGSAEYNLALGERRAEVVKEYLTNLGVGPDRILTRSLGKEAPFCRESDESCWSQNRRDHLVVTEK